MDRVASLHVFLSGLAIALVAAAIGDPLVESISNTGIFGRGFSDDNHQSVLTVLFAGIVLALLLGGVRLRYMLGVAGSSRALLASVAAGCARSSLSRNIGLVFLAQLAVVDSMENAEQVLAHGPALHGLAWLGAPAAFSLACHLIVCFACAFAARRATRWLLAGAAALCVALDRILVARERHTACGFAIAGFERAARPQELLAVRRIRGRAPPSVPALA